MQVEGRIKMIDQTKEVGSSGFKKRDVVVTTDEQFPQHILVQFVQDKCDLLNGYNVGEAVKIDINLRGREWTNSKGETVYFNTIQGWRIAKQDTSKHSPEPQSESAVDNYNNQQFAPTTVPNERALGKHLDDEPDDLPF